MTKSPRVSPVLTWEGVSTPWNLELRLLSVLLSPKYSRLSWWTNSQGLKKFALIRYVSIYWSMLEVIEQTCALSNWSLSISQVHTIVPVRPGTEKQHYGWEIFSCTFTTADYQQLEQIRIFGSTFPSFTVNSNDVFGVRGHPLPHVSCVLQHVPGLKSRRWCKLESSTVWQ